MSKRTSRILRYEEARDISLDEVFSETADTPLLS